MKNENNIVTINQKNFVAILKADKNIQGKENTSSIFLNCYLMEKHLIHQDNSFSCQQLFLEPGTIPDIEHITVKNQMQKPALMDNFLVENLYLIKGKNVNSNHVCN